jgi:hypothetical protein
MVIKKTLVRVYGNFVMDLEPMQTVPKEDFANFAKSCVSSLEVVTITEHSATKISGLFAFNTQMSGPVGWGAALNKQAEKLFVQELEVLEHCLKNEWCIEGQLSIEGAAKLYPLPEKDGFLVD